MALNFHQLYIFFTVAEKGNFSLAAQTLHMTQPAVTMQIQTLEDHFGIKLFHRSTKKVELSEAGRALLPYAQKSVELMKETDVAMSRFTRMLEGRLLIGASLTIGEWILPRLLGPFSKEHPQISIKMLVMNTTQIVEEITNNQLNFGLVEAPVIHPDIKFESVLHDEMKLIVPKGHPLFDKPVCTIQEVLQYPFVVREQGSGTRQVMEAAFKQHGVDPEDLNIVMELGSTGAVKSAVEAGIGISVISPTSVNYEMQLGLLRPLPIQNVQFYRHFYAVYLHTTLLPLSTVSFLTFLKERDLSQWLS